MAKKAGWIVAAGVGALLMQAQNDSPGVAQRTAANAREIVTPIASDVVGAGGDALLIVRDEASRQGINPGAILAQPGATQGRDGNGIAGVDDQGGAPLCDPNVEQC